ncbi:MAG: transcription elongation factor GreA [Phycisphaerales bacterium]|nr:transcription elongation factor GreA [Phycisphaerales bacterium]
MEFITKADSERLHARLQELRALDKVLITRIAEARAQGDLRENADYHASREDKSHNDARIRDIEEKLRTCQILGSNDLPKDIVFIGAVIKVRDEASGREEVLKLVTGYSDDADESVAREVTATSPMGQALMKTRIGDTVRVALPKGDRRLTVIEICS